MLLTVHWKINLMKFIQKLEYIKQKTNKRESKNERKVIRRKIKIA